MGLCSSETVFSRHTSLALKLLTMILALEITAIEKDSTGLRIGPVVFCARVCPHGQISIRKGADPDLDNDKIPKLQLRISLPSMNIDL